MPSSTSPIPAVDLIQPDVNDPYIIGTGKIKDPPKNLKGILNHLGPGFVLSAAVVGSGELIATTTLGARAGFIMFWIILLSCFLKVILQLEWGKHAIHSGETTMASLNRLPGWRLKNVSWSIYLWFFVQVFKFLQMGGIAGGVAIIVNMVFPQLAVSVWVILVTLLTSLLVYKGFYKTIERFSLVMMLFFTVLTLSSVYFLQLTPYRISWDELQQGFAFAFPPEMVVVAIAAFGITGVGGDEIMYYNYWCIEKGYASYTGVKDNSKEWATRAKGWIRIMYYDALLAMVVYTIVTAAFYLLGAAVLNRQGLIPEGYSVIKTLSEMYTQTLGPWAETIFMFGAFMALYSTLFTATASFSRMFTDAFGQIGFVAFYNYKSRQRMISILSWVIPLLWCALFIFIKLPVSMILAGGFMTSILLLLVVYTAMHFRYQRLPAMLKPGLFYMVIFWLSSAAIVAIGIYGIWQILS